MIFGCSSGFSPRNDGFVKARDVEFDYAIKRPVLLLKYFVPIKGVFFYLNNMTRLIRTLRAC